MKCKVELLLFLLVERSAGLAASPIESRKKNRCPRLWLGDHVAPPLETDGCLWRELEEHQVQYLSRVMRLKDGDLVRVFGALAGEWIARLSYGGSRKKSAWVSAVEQTRPPAAMTTPLELCFAPLRKKRTTLLIEKAVELGVTSLRAVDTEYTERASLASLASSFGDGEKITSSAAVEASEQCERLDVPLLYAPVSLAALDPNPPLFVCVERENNESTPHLLTSLLARGEEDSGCALIVGPEGGFSPSDLDILRARQDTIFVSLGPAILRAETAAAAALAIVAATRENRVRVS